MARGDPVRVRSAVFLRGAHAGYVTAVEYPDRDISAFPAGLPLSELAVADLSEAHVALFERFKAHWLVRCGQAYCTAGVAGAVTAAQRAELAALALDLREQSEATRADRLAAALEAALAAE